MKLFNILLALFLLVFVVDATAQSNNSYSTHGNDFPQSSDALKNWKVFENLNVTDTTATQISGEIKEVCQSKGCWMKVELDNNEEVFVKFKDYGFFVPLDAANKQVVMQGLAFVEEMSVDEQRHYAEDKGATEEEIAKIAAPKKTLRFEADGVVIQK